MNPIKINLSNTALGTSGCILHLKRVVIDGLVEPAMDANLVFGIAVHKFIDTMYKTKGDIGLSREAMKVAFLIPKNHNRKSPHLSDFNYCFTVAYNTWYQQILADTDFEILELDGKPATEVTFSIPYYKDEFIDVNLEGTIDRIGKIKGGCYLIRDWKTTSSWDNKGYFKSYELSRQLRLYHLAIKYMAKNYTESILGKIGATNVGAQIDAIFLKPSANDVKYYSSEVFQYVEKEMVEFEDFLREYLVELSNYVRKNYFPKQGILNGSCELKFGKCAFWNVCAASNDAVRDILLKRDFVTRQFTPLHYNTP